MAADRMGFMESVVQLGRQKEVWGMRVSPSLVSDLNKKIYGTIEVWRNRSIEGDHPYV